MSACEKCWRDAALRAIIRGGMQVTHYHELLAERKDNPCEVSTHDEGGES